MKKLFVLLVLISSSFSGAAQTALTLKCTSGGPFDNGRAILTLQPTQNRGYKIAVKLQNAAATAVYSGLFHTELHPKEVFFSGKGVLGQSFATIHTSLQPNQSGLIHVSIYSSDRRFNHGFGLPLACR